VPLPVFALCAAAEQTLLVLTAALGSTADSFSRGLTWAYPPAQFTSSALYSTNLAGQIPAVRGNLVVPQRGKTETGGGQSVTSRSRELPLDRRARRSDAARAVRVHRDKKRWSHRGTNHNSERGSEPGSDGLTRPCGSRANREGSFACHTGLARALLGWPARRCASAPALAPSRILARRCLSIRTRATR